MGVLFHVLMVGFTLPPTAKLAWLVSRLVRVTDRGFASTRLCVLVWRELHYY